MKEKSGQMKTNGKNGTDKLSQKQLQNLAALHAAIDYRPVPHPDISVNNKNHTVWRIRLESATNPAQSINLDINGEVILGRGDGSGQVNLELLGGTEQGVSRRHAILRPTATKLYITDLGSTNGTKCSGHPIGVSTPHTLKDLDTLSLGQLHLMVRVVQRPHVQHATLRHQANIADALIDIAESITSHLELSELLNQISETTMTLTSAGEVGIWLVDDEIGDLVLEAHHGIDDEEFKKARLSISNDSQAVQVISTGKTLRTSRTIQGEQVKVKTGHLVEAVIYVPLTVGGMTFGVIMAAHREAGNQFTERDERLLEAIAHFAAIAVQNARLYSVADKALKKRAQELASLNDLTRAVSSSLDLAHVCEVLVQELNSQSQTDGMALWLVNSQTGEPSLFSDSFTKDGGDTTPVHGIQELVKNVLSTGQLRVLNNLPQRRPETERKHDTLLISWAVVCLPLKIQEHTVGVLALFRKGPGKFREDDITRLESFSYPIATAIQNARLYAASEHERATMRAIARIFPHPLLIVNEAGDIYVSNDAAERVLNTHMSAVIEALSTSVSRTTRVEIGGRNYVCTTEYEGGIGTISIMLDVTEYQRSEEALRQSEQRYRMLVETSPDAITVTDTKGIITVCNWQAAALHHLSGPEEAVGKSALDFIAPEDRSRAEENLQKVITDGTVRDVEYTFLKKDGSRFPVEANISLLVDSEKNPSGYMAVARDITRLKQLEKTRSDFVHALSHDLKGPLTAIKGWGELLLHDHRMGEEHDRYATRITHACDSMSQMIGQILDIASPDKMPKLQISPVNLEEIITRVVETMDGAALVKQIELKHDSTGEPCAIRADEMRLYRAVLNLVENAIKYSPDGSSVKITVTYNDQQVTITVTDTGMGIPEEDIPFVFEQYYRGRQADGDKAGTGLGLATVRNIISAHNGTIIARNAEEAGAQFVITLPVGQVATIA